MIRGIGVEGIASEIGALSRHNEPPCFIVRLDLLVTSLMRRYNATQDEAIKSINKGIFCGVVERLPGGDICLVNSTQPAEKSL